MFMVFWGSILILEFFILYYKKCYLNFENNWIKSVDYFEKCEHFNNGTEYSALK